MIPFSPPRIDQAIIDEVVDTLKSGWITTGPKTKQFERNIAEYCGCQRVLCVSSASAGLELILKWFGVKEGDEVIIPAYTYCATANVVVHCGAKPVMVDVNEDFNISIENIKNAITNKTKAIIPVDIAGFPCDYDELNNLVQSPEITDQFIAETPQQKQLNRILVLSDAAHSLGAIYKGKKTGSICDITVFSFHAVKNLTTAEGGAIAINLPNGFNAEEIYSNLNMKSLHGQSKDALAKSKIGNWKYDVLEAGYKCNMTDIQASMGLIELDRYDSDMLIKRKHIFSSYTKYLSKLTNITIPDYSSDNKTSSFHVYLLRIKNITEKTRDKIIEDIFQQNVSVNVHFIPLPMLSYYKKNGYNINSYPIAYKNYIQVISLPVYYDLSDKQIKLVSEAVINSVRKFTND